MTLSRRVERRLTVQGYDCRTTGFERMAPWVRFSPVICSVVGAVGTLLAAPSLLAGFAVVAALGAWSPVHPFDRLYNRLVRRYTRTGPLPPNAAPRRFACAVATGWLSATALAFYRGRTGPDTS